MTTTQFSEAGVLSRRLLHPGQGAAGRLAVGQRLRIYDVAGKQVSDLILYGAEDTTEIADMVTTCLEQDSWRVTEGGAIFSSWVRPMVRLTDDKVGVHGYTGGACTHAINKAAGVDQPGCQEALRSALDEIGYSDLLLQNSAMLNVFQPPLTQPDGSFHPHEPKSRAGDFIEFTAEIPVIWAASCCPYPGPINGFGPTDLEIVVLEPRA